MLLFPWLKAQLLKRLKIIIPEAKVNWKEKFKRKKLKEYELLIFNNYACAFIAWSILPIFLQLGCSFVAAFRTEIIEVSV